MNHYSLGLISCWIWLLAAAGILSVSVNAQQSGPSALSGNAATTSRTTETSPVKPDVGASTTLVTSTPIVPAPISIPGTPISTTPLVIVQPAADKATTWLDWVEKGVQAFAVMVGALWVWINYLLNRTHRARLEARITGEVLQVGTGLVKMVLTLKNVGLSKVDIIQEGTGVRIHWFDEANQRNPWQLGMTAAIWNSVSWIEPGESCEEQHVLRIPPVLTVPIKFELFVICKHIPIRFWRPITQTLRGSYVLSSSPKKAEVSNEQ